MIGTQVKDYRIIQEIGKGGMASVFLVEHTMLHNQAALKLLNQEYVRNEHIRKRFLAEARSMARMSHAGVIKVTDLIEENDTVAFVMEYIEGETLKEYLDRKGKLKDDEIKTIFSQMLEAVGYVHKQNLVHRDIKPSNFMIDRQGNVKLMDFGIAKTLDASSAEYTQTGTGMQMGTPMYMSPEQITETKSVTAQSDIYSLGVVLWQMVTGQKPYDTKTLSNFQLQLKIVQEPLSSTNTKWDGLINKACAKNSESRFQNCNLWLNEIRNLSMDNSNVSPGEAKTIISHNINDDVTQLELSNSTYKASTIEPVVSALLSNSNNEEQEKKIKAPSSKKINENTIILYDTSFEKLFMIVRNFMNSQKYEYKNSSDKQIVFSKGSSVKQMIFGAMSPNYIVHINYSIEKSLQFDCDKTLLKIEVQSLGFTAGLIGIQQRKNEQKKMNALIDHLINNYAAFF